MTFGQKLKKSNFKKKKLFDISDTFRKTLYFSQKVHFSTFGRLFKRLFFDFLALFATSFHNYNCTFRLFGHFLKSFTFRNKLHCSFDFSCNLCRKLFVCVCVCACVCVCVFVFAFLFFVTFPLFVCFIVFEHFPNFSIFFRLFVLFVTFRLFAFFVLFGTFQNFSDFVFFLLFVLNCLKKLFDFLAFRFFRHFLHFSA